MASCNSCKQEYWLDSANSGYGKGAKIELDDLSVFARFNTRNSFRESDESSEES